MNNKLFLIVFSFVLIFTVSCEKENEEEIGTVTFGANYHIVDNTINVSVMVDRQVIGLLISSTNEITECGAEGNFTYDFEPGEHSYIVQINTATGSSYTDDLTGTFNLEAGECEKILIDFNNL